MKLYGILVNFDNGEALLSSISGSQPHHYDYGKVAIVSSYLNALETYVKDIRGYKSKVVEVFFEGDRWQTSERFEKKYIYLLKGVNVPTYLTDGGTGLFVTTDDVPVAQSFTHDEIEGLASHNGLKLSAFEEVEVEQ